MWRTIQVPKCSRKILFFFFVIICKTNIIQNIELKEKRFGFEPEVTAKLARVPEIRIYEVGISYYGRTYLEGKKIGWKDGFRAIYCILKYNLFR